jgi:hypothetical protein
VGTEKLSLGILKKWKRDGFERDKKLDSWLMDYLVKSLNIIERIAHKIFGATIKNSINFMSPLCCDEVTGVILFFCPSIKILR